MRNCHLDNPGEFSLKCHLVQLLLSFSKDIITSFLCEPHTLKLVGPKFTGGALDLVICFLMKVVLNLTLKSDTVLKMRSVFILSTKNRRGPRIELVKDGIGSL